MYLILITVTPRRRCGGPADACAVMTVVPKTFLHARASTGTCDLNPIESVLTAVGNTLSFQPFTSVGDKMIRSNDYIDMDVCLKSSPSTKVRISLAVDQTLFDRLVELATRTVSVCLRLHCDNTVQDFV